MMEEGSAHSNAEPIITNSPFTSLHGQSAMPQSPQRGQSIQSLPTSPGLPSSPFARKQVNLTSPVGTPSPGKNSKRGPYRCGRCGQLLKGHTCPYKDYSPSPKPFKTKRASMSDLLDGEELPTTTTTLTSPMPLKRASESDLDNFRDVKRSHLAALQLLSISNNGEPSPEPSGDALGRFLASLQRYFGIPKETLDRMLQDELSRKPECSDDDMDTSQETEDVAVSSYTMSIIQNLVFKKGLKVHECDADGRNVSTRDWKILEANQTAEGVELKIMPVDKLSVPSAQPNQ